MLDDITLYRLTDTGPSSARLYRKSAAAVASTGPVPSMLTPTAISMLPREQVRVSRRWAGARFGELQHSDELAAGGHVAALEQPALLVEEIRTGLRDLR